MRNKLIAGLLGALALFGGCSEYELEVIEPTVTPGPVYIPDDLNPDFPFQKQFDAPDGPFDLGDPLLPDIELSFTQHDFGTQELHDPPTNAYLEIRNVGDYLLKITSINQTKISNSFVIAPLPNMEIHPGSQEVLIISYAPTIHGPDGDTLQIESDDPDEPLIVVYLAGRGATPELYVDPKKVKFGAIEVTDTPSQVVDLENIGDGHLNISSIIKTKSNPDINIVSYPNLSLAPGQKTSMEILYAPSGMGSDKEVYDITSNDPNNPLQSVTVKGETKEPDIEAPVSLSFGMLDLGQSSKKDIIVENVGTGILTIAGVYFTNSSPAFSVTKGFTGDVAAGMSEKIEIEYVPDDYVSDSAAIEIMSNDPDEPVHTWNTRNKRGTSRRGLREGVGRRDSSRRKN